MLYLPELGLFFTVNVAKHHIPYMDPMGDEMIFTFVH